MNSTAFSLLANSNSKLDKNQEMELTIGSLSIIIGHRVHPASRIRQNQIRRQRSPKQRKRWNHQKTSSEVNSPVSFEKPPIAEGDKIWENFDSEERACQAHNKAKENLDARVQLDNIIICLDDILDKSADTWKTGLELSEDDSTFSSFNSNIGKQCQVLAIVGDNSEEFDENNNPVLNPANVDRGANHLAEGQTAESLTVREKIRLSVDEWRIIREAVEHGTLIPSNSRKDMLLGYHYALRQQAKQLAKEKIEIQRRKDSVIAASEAAQKARSDASYSNARKNC
jgi:hypothetical protein